jgi:hypothetical protein
LFIGNVRDIEDSSVIGIGYWVTGQAGNCSKAIIGDYKIDRIHFFNSLFLGPMVPLSIETLVKTGMSNRNLWIMWINKN